MSPLKRELEKLARADRHIARAEACLARQQRMVERCLSVGWGGAEAQALLTAMQTALCTMRSCRATSLRRAVLVKNLVVSEWLRRPAFPVRLKAPPGVTLH
jgi:hypothetical protein